VKKCHGLARGYLQEIKPGEDTERYLRKFLDATNSTMFFARRIILVEGIAEELLIPKFFELHTDKTLEKVGCSLINVRGLAFKHFLEIIRNGYFVKCVVFTDSDAGTKAENRASDLQNTYEKEDGVIKIKISSKKTFEKDLIEANKKAAGKTILLNTLQKTKPSKGKACADKIALNDIETEDFFKEIEHYKSEFAYDLLSELQDNHTGINIPAYIKEGFEFIYPNEKKKGTENKS
jgi:predicted ATP-dependent endonuclease of OLD family